MAREPMERFEESFKSWAARPPETSPEEAAGRFLDHLATRDLERASSQSKRPGWGWLNAVAALLLGAVMTLRFVPGPSDSPNLPGPVGGGHAPAPLKAPPLPDDIVVMWLDSDTPLYFTMKAPDVPSEGPST